MYREKPRESGRQGEREREKEIQTNSVRASQLKSRRVVYQ